MTKNAKLLPQVHVASPCPAAWEEMNGDARSRFCAECKLNVYNLSDMSTDEAEEFLAAATGRVCIRYYRRSDGKVMTRDCPRGLAAARQRFAAMLLTGSAIVLAVGFAMADGIRGRGESDGPSRLTEIKDKLRSVPAFNALLDKIDPGGEVAGAMAFPAPLPAIAITPIAPKAVHPAPSPRGAKSAKASRP